MSKASELITSLVGRIYSNQLTRNNVNNQVDEITKEIELEHYKKDRIISLLEEKVKSLENNIDEIGFKVIDQIVKRIQDRTPFFVDPFVEQAGDIVKHELDKLTDTLVESILKLASDKKNALEEKLGIDVDEKVEEVLTFNEDLNLSDKNKEILKNLREKHSQDASPKEEEEGD